MIPSTLFAFAAILSSFAAVSGGVVQRDGTFTYLSPQPTAASSTGTIGALSTTGTTSTIGALSTTGTTNTTSATGTPTSSLSFNVTSALSTTPTGTGTSVSNGTSPTNTYASTTPTFSFVSFGSSTPKSTPSQMPSSMPMPSGSGIPSRTPSQTLSSVPMPSGTGTVSCNSAQQWQAFIAYNGGDKVIYNGQLFTARQWTYNNAPATHPDQWAASGTCTQPINNQANCTGVSAWQSTVAYTSGSLVTFNNHLWSAVQWTQSNTPGDTSGSWKDQGACA